MKGITHFLFGLALATCFATAVDASILQSSLIILLGGIFGILPDFIDFRFTRYIETHDYELSPGIEQLNPQRIAQTLAKAIDEAYALQRPVKVKLHSLKTWADYWRRYSVKFVPTEHKVIVRIGPLVTTGQVPLPNTEPPPAQGYAEATYKADLVYTYEDETFVDIFHGNDFAFVPDKYTVRADFIPWHRRWSHSLTVGLIFGPIGLLLYGINILGITAVAIIVGAYWGHVLVDQIGMLGSNLFYPFTTKRTEGWRIIHHSGDAFPNFVTNYGSITVIIWNLNAYGIEPILKIPIWLYFLTVLVLPVTILYGVYRYYLRYVKRKLELKEQKEQLEAEESLREIEEVMMG